MGQQTQARLHDVDESRQSKIHFAKHDPCVLGKTNTTAANPIVWDQEANPGVLRSNRLPQARKPPDAYHT